MKAIVPVAGYGTRLKPHTERIQKSLLPVAGKATLDYIIEPLISLGVEEIILIVGYLEDQIVEHVSTMNGNFRFVTQKDRLGLGHAVYQGLDDVDSPLLIHLGDTIFDLDFQDFTSKNINRIAVGQVDDPSRFGVVDVNVENRITGFYEKHHNPPSNLAITGLYHISSGQKLKSAIETLMKKGIMTKGEYQLTDALDVMLKGGADFRAYELNSWMDVGVPETFIDTNRYLLKPQHGDYPGVEIREPVFIGENCRITASRVGPYVTIMNDCIIENCELEDSIILEGSQLKKMNFRGKIVGRDGSEVC